MQLKYWKYGTDTRLGLIVEVDSDIPGGSVGRRRRSPYHEMFALRYTPITHETQLFPCNLLIISLVIRG
jgi:hypothetical protein